MAHTRSRNSRRRWTGSEVISASPATSPKGISGRKKNGPSRMSQSLLLSGAPSLSPLQRGLSGHDGHNEKRDGLPPVGDYFHNHWFTPIISRRAFPPATPSPPCPFDLPAVSTAHLLWVGTIVAAGSLAGLFAAAASLERPRTRRQIHPTSTHIRCSTTCQGGAI
jgi:hypothetical protein